MNSDHRLSIENIEEAYRVIDPAFRDSPQIHSRGLSELTGCRMVVKIETLNPIRSFKGRGADYFVRKAADPKEPLVCASAGNFGQGLACAAAKRDISLTVFAAATANPLKVEKMRSFGAQVIQIGADFDAAKRHARDYAERTGGRFVEDGREPAISEGAGTIGLEMMRGGSKFDALVIPLGNGALLGGTGRYVRAASPETRIIGVCASGAPSMEISWRSGVITETPTIDTIADGIGVRVPIGEAVEDLRTLVDDILLVDDDRIIEAMRLIHRELGIVIEPAGAAGLAAILSDPGRFADQTVGTVLCGGNLTSQQIRDWLVTI